MATVVAIPLVFFTRGSTADADMSVLAVNAVGVTTVTAEADPTTTSAGADSLLDSVDDTGLLDGGADPTVALAVQDSVEGTTLAEPPIAGSGLFGIELTAPTSGPGLFGLNPVAQLETDGSDAAEPVVALDVVEEASSEAAEQPTTTSPPVTTATSSTEAPTTAPPETAPPETSPPPTEAPTTQPPTTQAPADDAASEPSSGGPTAAQWEALRQCESFGDYGIVSGNGLYHGAYQFGAQTWDSTARSAGRSDLVGVLPSAASAADQDAMAQQLWNLQGWAPWPHCGIVAQNA